MLVWYMLSSCVRPSICLSQSQAGIVPKWLNVGSRKQRCTIARGLYSDAKDLGKIPTASYTTGVPSRGGVGENRRFSTNISLYLRNGARQGHSYYWRLIATRMHSIKWCYFHWPWVTPSYLKQPHFHHNSASYENSSLFLAQRLPLAYPTLCWKAIRVSNNYKGSSL